MYVYVCIYIWICIHTYIYRVNMYRAFLFQVTLYVNSLSALSPLDICMYIYICINMYIYIGSNWRTYVYIHRVLMFLGDPLRELAVRALTPRCVYIYIYMCVCVCINMYRANLNNLYTCIACSSFSVCDVFIFVQVTLYVNSLSALSPLDICIYICIYIYTHIFCIACSSFSWPSTSILSHRFHPSIFVCIYIYVYIYIYIE